MNWIMAQVLRLAAADIHVDSTGWSAARAWPVSVTGRETSDRRFATRMLVWAAEDLERCSE